MADFYIVRPNGETDQSLWDLVAASTLPQVVGSLAAGSYQVRALAASAWSDAVTVTAATPFTGRVFDAATGVAATGLSLPWNSAGITAVEHAGGYLLVDTTGIAENVRTALVVDEVADVADVDLLTRVWVESAASTSGAAFRATAVGLMGRISGAAASESGGMVQIRMSDDFTPEIYDFRAGSGYDAGAAIGGTEFGAGEPTKGEWWYLRYNTATGLSKAWRGTPADEATAFTATLAPPVAGVGKIGLFFFARAVVRVEFISWGLGGNPALFPA